MKVAKPATLHISITDWYCQKRREGNSHQWCLTEACIVFYFAGYTQLLSVIGGAKRKYESQTNH